MEIIRKNNRGLELSYQSFFMFSNMLSFLTELIHHLTILDALL